MAQVSHVMEVKEVKEVMWPSATVVLEVSSAPLGRAKDECSAGCMPLEQR